MTQQTPVIFRKIIEDGSCIAFFPTQPYAGDPYECTSYMHVGQHGAASYEFYVHRTRPAMESEYAQLQAELVSIGYSLDIRTKWSSKLTKQARTMIRRAARAAAST